MPSFMFPSLPSLGVEQIGDGLLHIVVSELIVRIVHREPLHFLAVGPEDEYGRDAVDVQLVKSVAEILVQKDVREGRLLLLEESLGLLDRGAVGGIVERKR